MSIQYYMDSADLRDIKDAAIDPTINGITTNPTLMRKSGVADYEEFARQALDIACPKPVSFEVFSDDLGDMAREARIISSWGGNVFVKIPVMTTNGTSTAPIIKQLSQEGLKLNVTAVFTFGQIKEVIHSLSSGVPSIISIFAGRLADSGIDPELLFKEACLARGDTKDVYFLWASTREVFNLVQAERSGADIITVTANLLKKRELFGKKSEEFCRETVKMFYDDATSAGYKINS